MASPDHPLTSPSCITPINAAPQTGVPFGSSSEHNGDEAGAG
jgi:hypothetical protein